MPCVSFPVLVFCLLGWYDENDPPFTRAERHRLGAVTERDDALERVRRSA